MYSNRRHYTLFIFLICAAIIIAKLPSLSLPYFWDEAWPYATGVRLMLNKGLSLLPGAIPFNDSRGHPLLFHFLSALWMKVFGSSLFISHVFPLIISLSLVTTIYLFGKKYFSAEAGICSALFISVQPVFLAQSSMILPEIMLAEFSLATLYFYLAEKWIPFLLCSLAMLMVKESGIVLPMLLLLVELAAIFKEKKWTISGVRRILFIIIPVLIASVFFIIQKIETGYFFLPGYTAADNFRLETIISKFLSFSTFLFIYQGRNALSILLILSLVLMFITKRFEIYRNKKREIKLLCLFIVFFLLFSASNNYSPRYILNIFPPFVLIVSYFFIQSFKNNKWVAGLGLVSSLSISVFFCSQRKFVDDKNLGYVDGIETCQKIISYCETNKLYNEKIYANFLMRSYMTNAYCGYLSSDKKFENTLMDIKDSKYLVINSYEKDSFSHSDVAENNFKLVKRFEKNNAWTELYKRDW